jgi:hypothetical protein
LTVPIRVSLTLVLLLAAGRRGGNAQSTTAASPQIFFAESPALLILIDGDPIYRPVEGTDLERIANTRALIVRDPVGIHYLKVLDGWMESYTLTGDWSPSGVPPGGTEALEPAADAKIVDLVAGSGAQAVAGLVTQPPAIFIATSAAELIVTDGPPRYRTIAGTSLEYLANTTAKVFREPTDQELYLLVNERWMRAWTTDGPWQFVPVDELPADIAASITKTRKHDHDHLQP